MDITVTFPKRLIISLERRVDRREKLAPRFAAAGLSADWLKAIDGREINEARGYMSLSKRANALSKRLAIREACLAGAEAVLIFEDDVMFHPQFAERVAALTLPSDWGMFYFGCLHREPPQQASPGIVRASRCFDHHAFAVRRDYFNLVRKTMRGWGKKANGRLHSDVLVSDLHKTIPTYAAYPNLAWQAEDFSDLADRCYSNYRPDVHAEALGRRPFSPVIHVSYCGRLGNNLFQFAFGAVLSRLSGRPMTAPPIRGFPGTNGFAGPPAMTGNRIPLHGFNMEISEWAERAKHCDIHVHGYPHNATYYEPHHAWLASMLAPAPGDYAAANVNDIVLHFRLGDFFSRDRYNIDRFGYPVEAIYKLLSRLAYARCLIVTDSPKHDAIAHLVREHRGVIASGDRDHDYRTLFNAPRLIMSPSTFSWWAAWSGRATEIYFPHEMGYWQTKHNCQLAIHRPSIRRYDARGELI